MLGKFLIAQKPSVQTAIKAIILIVSCTLSILLLFCITAVIIVKIDTPDTILVPLTTILFALAAFGISFLFAKSKKENGFIIGISIGIVFFAMIVLIALFTAQFKLSNIFFTKFFTIMISGALGGVLGVNIN